MSAEVFATNAGGTSVATSLLAASGGDVYGGLRLWVRF
jgi:hypothetical protein